jgi:hypothetical protein
MKQTDSDATTTGATARLPVVTERDELQPPGVRLSPGVGDAAFPLRERCSDTGRSNAGTCLPRVWEPQPCAGRVVPG